MPVLAFLVSPVITSELTIAPFKMSVLAFDVSPVITSELAICPFEMPVFMEYELSKLATPAVQQGCSLAFTS